MKRRILTLVALTALVLSIDSQAAELRGIAAKPRISFSNTAAICTAVCYGDHSGDEVKATLTLYQGSNSGIDSVSVYGEGKVKSGKSYTLKLTYSVNGVSKPAVSTTAICPSPGKTFGKVYNRVCIYADPEGISPLGLLGSVV